MKSIEQVAIYQQDCLASRRQFISRVAVAGTVLGGLWPRISSAKPTDYSGLDTDKYLGPAEVLATIEDAEVFTEGPAGDGEGNLLFTNVPVSKILKWDAQANRLSVFRTASNETNGLYFAPDGSLLACEGAAKRITRTDMKTGKVSVLADNYEGKPFAKPNDLCMDGKGRVYFSARTAAEDPPGESPKGVYRIDPDGKVTQVLSPADVHMPNGLVTSPDNSKLYVIEAHPDANRHRDIRVYDLGEDGSVSNGKVLIDFYPGRSGDGMCIDELGNLYVAAGLHQPRKTSESLDTKPGIHVISPTGKLLAFRETPEDTVTNCAFGGKDLKTLYVTCGTKLVSIRTSIAGKAAYRVTR